MDNPHERDIDPVTLARQFPDRWDSEPQGNLTKVYFHNHDLEKLLPERKQGWKCEGLPDGICFSGITDYFQSSNV